MLHKTVTSKYTTYYPDPIVVQKGEKLTLGRTDNWDGHVWVWATATNKKEGWVPDNLAREKDGHMVAKYDYSAVELTCNVGDVVIVIREDHGWAWCKAENDNEGWIPLRNLS